MCNYPWLRLCIYLLHMSKFRKYLLLISRCDFLKKCVLFIIFILSCNQSLLRAFSILLHLCMCMLSVWCFIKLSSEYCAVQGKSRSIFKKVCLVVFNNIRNFFRLHFQWMHYLFLNAWWIHVVNQSLRHCCFVYISLFFFLMYINFLLFYRVKFWLLCWPRSSVDQFWEIFFGSIQPH